MSCETISGASVNLNVTGANRQIMLNHTKVQELGKFLTCQ